VYGASGALGSAIVRRLSEEGLQVKAAVHKINDRLRSAVPSQVELLEVDVLDRQAVLESSRGAAVLYHTVNVSYQNWESFMPAALDNVLSAAEQNGANLLFPGNVYGYGRLGGKAVTEEQPLAATSKKGRIRNQLEHKIMEAHQAGKIKAVIPRFPDFYGPNVTNRIFGTIFLAAISGKKASWIGKLDVAHDLVFIDDAAKACVLLALTKKAYGNSWHVPGPGPLTGRRFIEMVFEAAGEGQPKIGVIGSVLMHLVGLGSADAREMAEMMYEFEEPLMLDGGKFSREFPDFKFTPHHEAISTTVQWFRQNPAISVA
jgi:nucleoside-diphosphate-sugar epimerase